jgi:L-ascorbate metabolism protein UlaG (beta-lactamase superfamily)
MMGEWHPVKRMRRFLPMEPFASPDVPRAAAVDDRWRTVRAAAPSSEPPHVRITFLGHSTVLVEVDSLRILTDPVLGPGLGPVRRQVDPIPADLFADLDAVFVSHAHHDHLDLGSLHRIPGRPTVLVPRGLGRLVGRHVPGPVEEVAAGEHLVIDRVRFEVVHAEHDGWRAPFGPRAPALGCVLRGSRTVYFPGDTDLFPAMAELAGSDVALLPVWGWGPNLGRGHLDPERAAEAAILLRPRLAVPIHWGTLYPLGLRRVLPRPFRDPGGAFADAVARRAPDLPVTVLKPGQSLRLGP